MSSLNQPPSGSTFRNANAPYQMLRVSANGIPDMSVRVEEGGFWANNENYVEFIGGPSPVVVAPSVVDSAYWVAVVLNMYGQLELLYGEAVLNNPQLPVIPYNALPLAAILVNSSCTQITQDMINDVRPVFYTGYPRLNHSELLGNDAIDLHPMQSITGLATALASKVSLTAVQELLKDKTDKSGTVAEEFVLNKDHAGVPASNCYISVNRGTQPKVGIRYNEQSDCWQFTNNGIDWLNIQGGVSIVDASTTNKGFAFLSVDPVDPVSPIAVGTNDPRMFTEDGKSSVLAHLTDRNDPHGTLKADCITNLFIKNEAVTSEKIADLAVGQTKIAEGAITGSKIAPTSIDGSKLSDLCIDNTKLADLSVTESKISNGSITGPKIAPAAVDTSNIVDGSIDHNKLADLAVTAAKLTNSAVQTAKVADLAITTAKIANSAVDSTKLASCACTTEKLADLAVTTIKVDDGAITMPKLGGDVLSAINGKLDSADLSAKADLNYTPTAPGDWSNVPSTIYAALDRLANDLVSKAGTNDVAIKADKNYVDTQLGTKADTSYVDTQLASKADAATINVYSALDPSKWSGSAPTTITEAIERLLNAVYVLNSNTAI